jgi:hypothetical protein
MSCSLAPVIVGSAKFAVSIVFAHSVSSGRIQARLCLLCEVLT